MQISNFWQLSAGSLTRHQLLTPSKFLQKFGGRYAMPKEEIQLFANNFHQWWQLTHKVCRTDSEGDIHWQGPHCQKMFNMQMRIQGSEKRDSTDHFWLSPCIANFLKMGWTNLIFLKRLLIRYERKYRIQLLDKSHTFDCTWLCEAEAIQNGERRMHSLHIRPSLHRTLHQENCILVEGCIGYSSSLSL